VFDVDEKKPSKNAQQAKACIGAWKPESIGSCVPERLAQNGKGQRKERKERKF